MKKKIRVSAALLALCLLLSGCSFAMERDYLYVEQHDEMYQEDLETDTLTVDSYYGLRSAVLSFVESGTEYGVIRSYSYDGDDIEEDLEEIAYEITRSDPLGSWAVDYMSHDCNRIVSYYEITISITFRRTAEEIAALLQVSSLSAAEAQLIQAVEDCADAVAMRLSYTSELDAQEVLEAALQENPLLRLGSPSVSMQLYPDSGVQRILELVFSWEESAAVVTTKREQAQEVLDKLGRYVSDTVSDQSRASIYFRRLCNRTGYDPDSDGDDIYAALVGGSSGSRGIAEAFYLLCTQNGLDCTVISGRKNGEPHWWNQLTLDGQTCHVDVSAALEEGSSIMTLYYDEDLYATYTWDASLYPASTRPAEETEEEPAEPEESEEAGEESGETGESAYAGETAEPADSAYTGETAEPADAENMGETAGTADSASTGETAESVPGPADGAEESTDMDGESADSGQAVTGETGTDDTDAGESAGTGETAETGGDDQTEPASDLSEDADPAVAQPDA